MGVRATWWQLFLMTPGMIAVNDGVLVGAFGGLPLACLFGPPLPICTVAGVVAFGITVVLLQIYHWKQFKGAEELIPALFPRDRQP